MADKTVLAAAIAAHLRSQLDHVDNDDRESLEVAIETISAVYGLDAQPTYSGRPLLDIFRQAQSAQAPPPAAAAAAAPVDDGLSADEHKSLGNKAFREGEYRQAIEHFSKAIAISGGSPAFYGNRAAAYAKLGEHELVIRDCEAALRLDAAYVKAYARMGIANVALNRLQDAKKAYEKAVELDPANEGYHVSLEDVEERLRAQGSSQPRQAQPDLAGILGSITSDPQLMGMASSLLQSPAISNLLQNLGGGGGAMGGGQGGGASRAQPATSSEDSEDASAEAPEMPNIDFGSILGMLGGAGGGGAGGGGGLGAMMQQMAASLNADAGGSSGRAAPSGAGQGGNAGAAPPPQMPDLSALMNMASTMFAQMQDTSEESGETDETPD